LSTSNEHISSLYALTQCVISKPSAWQIAHPEHTLSEDEIYNLQGLLDRLLEGEPLAYITGKQSFFGREFLVSPSVLIPRPETELLVELAINKTGHFTAPIDIVDIGTGSGCIAITLAKEIPNAKVLATDISFSVLKIAAKNARIHNVSNFVNFIHCDLMNGINARFNIICANLPYIPAETLERLPDLRFEPASALHGGQDGMHLITRLVKHLHQLSKPNCVALFEIEETQDDRFLALSHSLYPLASIKIMKDLSGHNRIGCIEFKN